MPSHLKHTISCLQEIGGSLACKKTGQIIEEHVPRGPTVMPERIAHTSRGDRTFRWSIPKTTPVRGWLSFSSVHQHPDYGRVSDFYLQEQLTLGNYADTSDPYHLKSDPKPIRAEVYITRVIAKTPRRVPLGSQNFATPEKARAWMEKKITSANLRHIK